MCNHDPPSVTPVVKGLLRQQNTLMRQNKTEAANAITSRINRLISQANNCNTFSNEMSTKHTLPLRRDGLLSMYFMFPSMAISVSVN